MRKLVWIFLLLGCTAAFAGDKKAAKTDPWVGDWKMDMSKSKFPTPGPKEETLTIAAADEAAVKYATKGTGPDGVPYTESYDGKPDGKAYPLTKNGQEVGRISYHRTSDHSSTGTAEMADGTLVTETITLSRNGKTITIKGHIKAGRSLLEETIVFNKK
jgi:hypothetical protein